MSSLHRALGMAVALVKSGAADTHFEALLPEASRYTAFIDMFVNSPEVGPAGRSTAGRRRVEITSPASPGSARGWSVRLHEGAVNLPSEAYSCPTAESAAWVAELLLQNCAVPTNYYEFKEHPHEAR